MHFMWHCLRPGRLKCNHTTFPDISYAAFHNPDMSTSSSACFLSTNFTLHIALTIDIPALLKIVTHFSLKHHVPHPYKIANFIQLLHEHIFLPILKENIFLTAFLHNLQIPIPLFFTQSTLPHIPHWYPSCCQDNKIPLRPSPHHTPPSATFLPHHLSSITFTTNRKFHHNCKQQKRQNKLPMYTNRYTKFFKELRSNLDLCPKTLTQTYRLHLHFWHTFLPQYSLHYFSWNSTKDHLQIY